MKSLTKLMAMGLLSVGLASCSSDDENLPQGGTDFGGADKVYMSLNLSFPQQRSATDDAAGQTPSDANPDFEVGVGLENQVNRMDIYLVDEATKTVLATGFAVPGAGNSLVGADGNYTAQFDGQSLKASASKQARVYVVCNGEGLGGEKDGVFAVTDVYPVATQPWSPFVMSNAKKSAVVTLPTAQEMVTTHASKSNPFNLGVVEVERAAARFDYMSKNVGDEYIIKNEDKDLVKVVLSDMALTNVSKSEYVYRHVGVSASEDICIPEVAAKYVITPDWASGTNYDLHQPILVQFNDKNTGKYLSLKDPMRPQDNWNHATELDRGDYKPMAYSSETTSASRSLEKQVTQVVFRGSLEPGADLATENAELKAIFDNPSATDNLYAFGNKIYGTWEMVKTAALAEGADNALTAAYKQAQAEAQAAGDDVITNAIAVKANFTVYNKNPQTAKYDVYYYYANKHNVQVAEEGRLDAKMLYAVVRNNVYKLKVNNILKYGHPFDPSGDPDPINPDEKVDPENVYFQVGVKVLPWTVRVNDIEF